MECHRSQFVKTSTSTRVIDSHKIFVWLHSSWVIAQSQSHKISFWLHSSWVIVRLPISIRFSIRDVCTALVALHFGLVEHLGRVIIVYHQVDQYMKKNIKKNIVSCYNILGYIIYNSTVIMTIIYLYIDTWLIFF